MKGFLIAAALLSLPVVAGGLAIANAGRTASEQTDGYICPITGEKLPCPECCPLCSQTDDK